METKHKEERSICRAMIAPGGEGSDYDFECVAVPAQNGQLRYSWQNDEYFNQILLVAEANVDRSRLDSGLPLFDNHPDLDDISILETYGITNDYFIDERGLVVRCKFGSRADQALKDDVKNGIIKTVSIEGSIQSYEVTRELGAVPQYKATLWTPESLSFAPVPNDISAQIEVKRAIQKQLQMPQAGKSFINKLTNKF